MISRMRGDPIRTLVVVAPRPHPWAMLRDRLDPELVAVSWARPEGPAGAPAPWMIAGTGADLPAGLADADRLGACCWVGPPPPGLPVLPAPCPDWRTLAAEVQRRLAVRLAGLRLAPGCGLALPDRYLAGLPELEALLAAHPDGIELAGGPAPAQVAAARLRRGLRRHGLPLVLQRRGARLVMVAAIATDVGAS